jgi:hypothetical protein
VKLQEHALPLRSMPWERPRQPLPAGVRAIGRVMPEVLNRYGLSLDELDECRPHTPATAFVPIAPRSHSVLESMAVVGS